MQWSNTLLVILLSIVCQKTVAASVTLTPTVVHACTGETVNFTCTATDGNTLDWSVNYVHPSSSDISRQRFRATDSLEDSKLVTNNVGYTFRFTLISASSLQLTSTANTTISSPQLNGTQVHCQSSNSASTSVIHVIAGPASISYLAVIDTIHSTENVHVNVIVQNTAIGDHQYFVSVFPSDELGQSSFVTQNKTVQLTVLYNHEYNITVVANNCAGNSSAVSTTFNIISRDVDVTMNTSNIHDVTSLAHADTIDCGFPVLLDGTEVLHDPYSTKEGSVITLRCAEHLIPRLNRNFTSTCTSEGEWNPDPSTYNCLKMDTKTTGLYPKRCDCEDNSQYNKAVAVGVSVTCFILGVVTTLVALLCWRCCNKFCRWYSKVKGQRQDDTCEPVYSECTLPSTHICNTTNNQNYLTGLNMDINTAYGRRRYIYM